MKRTVSANKEYENVNKNLPEDQELYFKYKNKYNEATIEMVDGKMICPICKAKVKNVNLHLHA